MRLYMHWWKHSLQREHQQIHLQFGFFFFIILFSSSFFIYRLVHKCVNLLRLLVGSVKKDCFNLVLTNEARFHIFFFFAFSSCFVLCSFSTFCKWFVIGLLCISPLYINCMLCFHCILCIGWFKIGKWKF